jgi:hypothetical protein
MIIKTVVTSTSTMARCAQLSTSLEATGTLKTLTPHVAEAATSSLEVVGVDDAVTADRSTNHVKFTKNSSSTHASFIKSDQETMT